jgi:hypothetical protein
MNKLNEMWEALAAYQPKADAEGHGKTWATMCKEKTSGAARAAWSAADAAYAAYASASADACDAARAAVAAYASAAKAAGDAGYAADASGYAEADRWAQKVIDRINKLKD